MPLAPYASDAVASRGRRHPEAAVRLRNAFQRDRDRIVHSTAFRRLVYKTQVFLNHEGDLFRTRLTHSLEVAQLGRSIARGLGLNEDLVEAIALAHDLGHTPFGHAGQDALHDCMQAHGGFEHNLQSLRVVDRLEIRYPAFDGLNLSFETREGILKHCSQRDALALEKGEPNGVAHRFLVGTQPSLEARLTNLADEIAYNAHDIDDGVRSGLLQFDALADLPPRVLVRTCERAPTRWSEVFSAYAPETLELLAARGVRLVGIDSQSVDPATSSDPGADMHGIVVCGVGQDGRGYVLDDVSTRGTPSQWATRWRRKRCSARSSISSRNISN